VDAAPLLAEVGRALREVNLEAVLIGNAAAALQGAPVTTVDFDFLFRRTSRNLAKLRSLAGRGGGDTAAVLSGLGSLPRHA
jgi:hypothetical protein